ncbi:hypothetical protein F5051DRAFT_184123 [Lentinula edodes]|nr:hypothetical protein F5051DRAFT_184123 [Lentinula edodes]
MLRACILVLVAISVIQAYAAVIPNTIPVCQSLNERQLSSSMLEVRGLKDKLQKIRTKFRQKLKSTSQSEDSDSIRAADTPRRSKASLNEGNEASIPSGAANSTTPKKHRGGRKMGPQPTSEEEDPSKGKEPALPDSSPFNDTSQIMEGSNATTSQTKHHHHHHRHHRTSNVTANRHDGDDGDDTSTLKPPRRHRGSTVTPNVKPDLKRVSSMSSESDYAVTLSSEDGNTRQSTKDTRPERLRSPGHHRTGSSASGRHRSSIDTVTRAGSSASRGPNRGSMNKPNDMSSTREREKEREREREREREKERAENRASALYAANQNTQNMQTTQSAAFNANTFATNFGNAAAPVPGMTKPPGTR